MESGDFDVSRPLLSPPPDAPSGRGRDVQSAERSTHVTVRDSDLGKGLPEDGVTETCVEARRGLPGMERHGAEATAEKLHLERPHQLLADVSALPRRLDRHLEEPSRFRPLGVEEDAAHHLPLLEGNEVQAFLLEGEGRRRAGVAEGCA